MMYRFAPSPTGDMHIGNLRAAIFNYICSKQDKSGFVLRIEDTDKIRNIEGKDEEIKELLKLFGISWQYLYIQSENLNFHQKMALKLVSEKKAFACFCTEEELNQKKELAKKNNQPYRYDGTCEKLKDIDVLNCNKPFVIRLKKPQNNIGFKDLIKGNLDFKPDDIDSFVILRTDKTPTYNFACAVDDMLENITCIIRGEDHVSNTPKQEHIRKSLNYEKEIIYAHLPIILNENGVKMSKREAHSSVKWLLEYGILPDAIINYLILLGNKTPCEIFTLEEAFTWFDIKKISKSPARFDLKKLLQINREHIKRMPNAKLNEILDLNKDIAELAKFYTQESSTLVELKDKMKAIFSAKDYKDFKEECLILKENLKNFNLPQNYEDFKEELMKRTNLKGKKFFMPLRIVLTGNVHGPELSDLYIYIRPFINDLARI